VVGYKADDIKNHLGDHFGKIKINYIVESERLGTAHALGVVEGKVRGKFIALPPFPRTVFSATIFKVELSLKPTHIL